MSKNNKSRYIPLIIAASIIAGIFIGNFYTRRFAHNTNVGSTIIPYANKLNGLFHIINNQYVDTVDINNIIENAMPQIL